MYLYSRTINYPQNESSKGEILSFEIRNGIFIKITFDNSQIKEYDLEEALKKNSLLLRQDKINDLIEINKTLKYFEKYGIPQNLDFLDEIELSEDSKSVSTVKTVEKSKELKKQTQELYATLLNFGFIGFVHGTDIETAAEILKSGYLYSRDYVEKNKLKFNDVANQDVLVHTPKVVKKFTRFYYYPKTPTLFKMCQKHKMCLLIFKWDLVKKYACLFTDGNAASKDSNYYEYEDLNKEPNALPWRAIFHRGFYDKTNEKLDIYITRARNAEMLSKEKISLEYLDKIIFKSESHRNELMNLISKEEKDKYAKYFEVDPSKLD